ncbi:hypothetical protein [Clostridium butyricum]|jgi:hypothetical protein|uniref:hypothetical protein n=1 Tax=Clostridium butyricum TaxID=1492 RepID=UPI0003D5F346|nr:MAG: hypothetical protein Q607_CBUC00058G0017 [Clostridium butyricum DORA_1]MDU1508991.1 hypothetical protein [Clostridium butyricum]MDU4801407.1 hypothetical protein [Clostridium butyricum]
MKSEWKEPNIINLSVVNTQKIIDKCPICNHPITHPEIFGDVSNHKGNCPNISDNFKS